MLKSDVKKKFDKIWREVMTEATKAANNCNPTPMGLISTDIFGNVTKDSKSYYVSEGACGFAWINISGRGNFAKYAKEELGAHKSYYGGIDIWYSTVYNTSGQSYERHIAACAAGAEVLNRYGIKARPDGRLD